MTDIREAIRLLALLARETVPFIVDKLAEALDAAAGLRVEVNDD